MGKRKAKKPKLVAKTPSSKAVEEHSPPPPADGEKIDFGGLPDTDLKKNLGCG